MKFANWEVTELNNDGCKVGCETVTKSQVETVLKMMKDFKEKTPFKVGDYVKVNNGDIGIHGKFGKIVQENTQDNALFIVEFAENVNGFGYKDVAFGHASWISKENLELVDKPKNNDSQIRIGNSLIHIISNNEIKIDADKCTIVSLHDIQILLDSMIKWEFKFQIGDFVKVKPVVTTEGSQYACGKFGKIIGDKGYFYQVEFAEKIQAGHSCYGKTKDGHGLDFYDVDLELVN